MLLPKLGLIFSKLGFLLIILSCLYNAKIIYFDFAFYANLPILYVILTSLYVKLM